MCNLYSQTKGQAAIVALTRALRDSTGNLPPLPGIFPDYQAPVVANRGGIRELCMMRWGMPSSQKAQLESCRLADLSAEARRAKADGAGRRHHQHPQHIEPALDAVARPRAPLRRAVHVVQRV